MASENRKRIEAELDVIRKKNGGLLQPRAVVDFARNKRTALHGCFEWDDTKAAEAHRLQQARYVIEVYVTIIQGTEEPVRAYVSLPDDRKNPGGGYRSTVEVLTDKALTEQLLAQALAEFNRTRVKYRQLKQLVPVFEAIDKISAKAAKRRSAGSGTPTFAAVSA